MLGSHNYMVSNYFDIAHSIAIETLDEKDKKIINSKTALVIIMSVSAVEAFINIFGRLWVEQNSTFKHSDKILMDLNKKRFITQKIKEWPQLFFDEKLDLSKGTGQDFINLIEKRNALMHFEATYETLEIDNFTLKGLVDISLYNSLQSKDALSALDVSKCFIESWITLQGFEKEHVKASTQHWIGTYAM